MSGQRRVVEYVTGKFEGVCLNDYGTIKLSTYQVVESENIFCITEQATAEHCT